MRRSWQIILDFFAYVAVRAAVCLVQAVPLETCQKWARRLAWLLWHVVRLRRDVIEENLAVAFPDATPHQRERIALGMWEHLVVLMAEIAYAPRKIHRSNWRQHSQFPQMEVMARRLLDDRPTVIVSGHLGNFELGGYLLGLHGFPTYTIARPLDNRFLDRWVNEFRGRTGQYVLPKLGSAAAIEQVMKAGGTLVLLGDQHAGDSGLWVDFFGKPASTHKAVALFTLGASAPTAVCAAFRVGGPLEIEMYMADLVDPAAADFELGSTRLLTEWYTRRLEDLIRRAPDQYWWVHRRWKGSSRNRRGQRHVRRSQAA